MVLDNADVVWVASCWPNAHVAGHGTKGLRIEHCDNFEGTDMLVKSRFGGYTLLHEWGHFFFGLYDEYQNSSNVCSADNPGSPCAEDVGVNNSAMHNTDYAINDEDDSLKDPNWLNFSTALTNSSASNAQYRKYQASAWEVLVREASQDPGGSYRTFYPELLPVAPAAGSAPSIELSAAGASDVARSALKIQWHQGATTATLRAEGMGDEYVPIIRELVVDTSSAMTAKELNAIKAALQSLVDRSEDGDIIGILSFDTQPKQIAPLTRISSEEDRDSLIAAIETLTLGTNPPAIGDALEMALEELGGGNLSEEANWTVFLFSGGQNLAGLSPEPVVRSYRDEDIMLLSFFTSASPDENLRKLSKETQGGYWMVRDLDELPELIEEAEFEASPVVDVLVATGYEEVEGTHSFSFYLDNTLDEVELNVSYIGDADNTTLALVDPSGNTVATGEEACGDVQQEATPESEVENFCAFEVASPIEGVWQLQVNTTSLVEVEYMVSALPKDNSNSYFASLESLPGDYLDPNTPVVLVASVGSNFPVTGVPIKTTVETPDGEVTEITLHDDGIAPDVEAQDGDYYGSYTPSASGDYFFLVAFDNSAGTAQTTNNGVAYALAPTSDGKLPTQGLSTLDAKFQRVAYTQVIVK